MEEESKERNTKVLVQKRHWWKVASWSHFYPGILYFNTIMKVKYKSLCRHPPSQVYYDNITIG